MAVTKTDILKSFCCKYAAFNIFFLNNSLVRFLWANTIILLFIIFIWLSINFWTLKALRMKILHTIKTPNTVFIGPIQNISTIYLTPCQLNYFFGFAILRPRLTVIIHILSLLLTQHCMVGLSELAPYIVNESAPLPCLFHVTGMFNPTPLYLNIFDKTEGKNQKWFSTIVSQTLARPCIRGKTSPEPVLHNIAWRS